MESTVLSSSVIDKRVVDKVVDRRLKRARKKKPAKEFHSISPDQMEQILARLDKMHDIAKASLNTPEASQIREQIELIEEILIGQLVAIEDPDGVEDSAATIEDVRRMIEEYQRRNVNGNTWITTSPTTTAPVTLPSIGIPSTGTDIIWHTMDGTSMSASVSDIPFNGLLPKNDDE